MPDGKKTRKNESDLLTKEQVAERLDTSPRYVFQLFQTGKIAGRKLSERKLRFTEQAVAEYLRGKSAGASSEASPALPADTGVSTPPLAQDEPSNSIPAAQVVEARQLAERTANAVDSLTKAQIREHLRTIARLLPGGVQGN